jgi:Flp pilus assembly protein TadD
MARSSNAGRPGGQGGNRSSFVARNFSNQGRGGQSVTANRGNFSRTASMTGNAGRNFSGAGRNSFVSRNFSNSGHNFSNRTGSDFNRGNFNTNSFSRNNFSNFNHANNWGHNNWGHNNWGGNNWGRNNWYGGGFNRGWGYGGWGGYGRYPFWGYGFYPGWGLFGLYGLGWGLGYGGWGGYGLYGGYGGYGYPYGYGYGNYTNSVYYADNTVAATPQAGDVQPQATDDHDARGEQAFRSGNYEAAIREWQHAMVDDPNNGALVALMAQALFAIGRYENAAGAVQTAMQMLPENEWGSVVKNYSQLYGNIGDYTTQLKALEIARDGKPDDPALRFELGYHFGYLGYPKNAVAELDKALDLQPQDLGSQKLRDIFAVQAGLPARPHVAPQQPPQSGPAAPPLPGAPAAVPGQNPPAPTPPAPGAAT